MFRGQLLGVFSLNEAGRLTLDATVILPRISTNTRDIKSVLLAVDPLSFLCRAFHEYAFAHSRESSDHERMLSLRMIEYPQSIFAAYGSKVEVLPTATEDQYSAVKKAIGELIVNSSLYSVASTIGKNDPTAPQRERLHGVFANRWINVRGERHSVHDIEHFKALIDPQNQILERLWQVSGAQISDGFKRMLDSLLLGLPNAYGMLKQICDFPVGPQGTQVRLKQSLLDSASGAAERSELEQKFSDAYDKVNSFALFNLANVSSWPPELCKELAWGLGEAPWSVGAEGLEGSPFAIPPSFQKPFIHIQGVTYCFDPAALCDRTYRAIERLVQNSSASAWTAWQRIRAASFEDTSMDVLRECFPGAEVFQNLKYSIGDRHYEIDGLLRFRGRLVAMEAKSGAWSDRPPSAVKRSERVVEELLLHPAKQLERFRSHVVASGAVDLVDARGLTRTRVKAEELQRGFLLSVTRESSGPVSGEYLTLFPEHVRRPNEVIFSASVDDLRIIRDVFQNKLAMLHYLEQRKFAITNPHLHHADEVDLIEYHLSVNLVGEQVDELAERKNTRVSIGGFSNRINEYFAGRYVGNDVEPPRQIGTNEFWELLSLLDDYQTEAAAELGLLLLNANAETRRAVGEGYRQIINRVQTTPGKIPSLHMNVPGAHLTITAISSVTSDELSTIEEKLGELVLTQRYDKRHWLCLTVFPGRAPVFKCTTFSKKKLLTTVDQTGVEAAMKSARERSARIGRRFGRNAQCPCGSGFKYKRCCGK